MDLSKCGVYAYSDSPNFEILLFAYAFDEEDNTDRGSCLWGAASSKGTGCLGRSGNYESSLQCSIRAYLYSKYLGRRLSPSGWQCTAVQSAMLALPLSLDSVGEVLNIQRKKLKEGADLVRFFSMPCKPTKANGGRTRKPAGRRTGEMGTVQNLLYPGRGWRSVRSAEAVEVSHPGIEMELYRMDQEINDRGILVDQQLVENAVLCDNQYRQMVTARAYELTGAF